MRFESERFPRFNLASMSGVYAGTRSDRFYRLRLWQLENRTAPLRWYQLHLTPAQDPPTHRAAASTHPTVTDLPPGDSGDDATQPAPLLLMRYRPDAQQTDATDASHRLPLYGESGAPVLHELQDVLTKLGFGLHSCATCRHWRKDSQTTGIGEPLPDEPPLNKPSLNEPSWGHCQWTESGSAELAAPTDSELTRQSALALGCVHWDAKPDVGAADRPMPHAVEDDAAAETVAGEPRRRAQPGLWARAWSKLTRQKIPGGRTAHQDSAPKIAERSGVGAGTEPCFACHGRLANLAALVVESKEGDPLTFSIWRCRVCRTTYLNRWVDRWVRMDNLETDESYFRIAPLEAAYMLALFGATPGADHPQDRKLRTDLRLQLETLAGASDLISRQTKQGR